MNAAIICNGAVSDYSFYRKYLNGIDYIIAADGGASHARRMGVQPHLLIGDFDSISPEDMEYYRNTGVEIRTFPVNKDKTDTEIAIDIIIEKAEKEKEDINSSASDIKGSILDIKGTLFNDSAFNSSVIIIGALGSRYDHSLANIFLLRKLLDKGIRAKIINESNEIMLINNSIEFEKNIFDKITLLPLSHEVTGITTYNMIYPLNNATIKMGSTWGVSNEFAARSAGVSIKSGEMLVILSKD